MWPNLKSADAEGSRTERRSSFGQRVLLRLLPVAGTMFFFAGGAAAAAVHPISGNHRLFVRFVEDGAIVQKGWIEFRATYEDYPGGGRDVAGGSIIALRFGRDVEAGLGAGLLDRRRASGAALFGSQLPSAIDGTGLADLLVYGKYRILRSPFDLAVGGTVTIPLADEDEGRGPGIFQYGAFIGARKDYSRATLVWSLGVTDRGDAKSPGQAEGEISLRLGTGLLLPVSRIWTLVGEATYESARFDGEEQTTALFAGLDWRPTNFLVARGGLGAGLTGDSPDISATMSFVFYF